MMGIYDRDYYRETSRGWSSWGDRPVTVGLVAVTCAVFILQLISQDRNTGTDIFLEWGAFHLPSIQSGQVWRLLTSNFLHGGLWHIVLNMFVLFWVGSELEAIYGSKEFLGFYLATALLVSLCELALGLAGLQPAEVRSFGASGVVNATFVLFACHYPYRTIYLFFILPVPAWLLAVGLVAIDFFGFLGVGRAGVAFAAHLAGAAFGFAYFKLSLRVTTWLPTFGRRPTPRRAPLPRLMTDPPDDEPDDFPVSAPAPRATIASPPRGVDEQLEAKLDLVLEKVSRYGRDSLTPEEKDLLLRASELYKHRRNR